MTLPTKRRGGDMSDLIITETLSDYHLGSRFTSRALCGVRVFSTGIPLSMWRGQVGRHDRWCAKCESEALGRDKP